MCVQWRVTLQPKCGSRADDHLEQLPALGPVSEVAGRVEVPSETPDQREQCAARSVLLHTNEEFRSSLRCPGACELRKQSQHCHGRAPVLDVSSVMSTATLRPRGPLDRYCVPYEHSSLNQGRSTHAGSRQIQRQHELFAMAEGAIELTRELARKCTTRPEVH